MDIIDHTPAVTRALDSLGQFAQLFQSLALTMDQHKSLSSALDQIRTTLSELEYEAQDWSKRYLAQVAELKSELITTAIDSGANDKTISL